MKYSILVFFCLIVQYSFAQPDSLYIKKKNIILDPTATPTWENKNKAGIDLNEVAFVNWSSGGSNSISAIVSGKSTLNYTHYDFIWNNTLNMRYGINQQESESLKKTDDLLEITSTLGYRQSKNSKWYYSARLNFKTQFANGYSYPDTSNPISKFMAPGYMFVGGGMEYGKDIKLLSFYLSPLTFKSTFVLDQELANAGAFGVTPAVYDEEGNVLVPGEQVREELGILVTNYYELTITKNVILKSTASFYTDYLNSFGNIDVDWALLIDFKVNNYIKASLGSHLIYDNDVKTLIVINEETDEYAQGGAKVQWRQALGIGFTVDF
ncbi:DUF3078 domain-containing protein [Formosa sp. PL04]|uniref:DUF3078 domain-containing protein n=1 Tax=Formosa sp. PL04 TaxID=3081755 RepID=UPI0029812F33|nr:DUF3078 domain-containing protein [Formosa sp. PL04]MDW5287640.1 DUF3078 domain-containing protein [Formosa sp. PL04]